MKKLQNSFNDFLPQTYREFRMGIHELTSNKAVVAELLRVCCEEDDVKAIKMAFERILGKPEKVVVIKRTIVKTIFPDARTKALKPIEEEQPKDQSKPIIAENAIVVDEDNAPGILLRKELDKMDGRPRQYSYELLDKKDSYTVAEVMAANLYGIAMSGSNLEAIKLLFDYLDGAVADVIRLEGEDTILLENWADVAPFEAMQDENGVFYVETVGVK